MTGPEPDTHGVEKRSGMHGIAEVRERTGKAESETVDPLRDRAQAIRPVIDRIHRGHDREKNLGRADVAGGLFATDVLLARLERETQGGISGGILGDADKPSGHPAFVLVPGGEERGMGAAESGRDAEALGRTDDDIRAEFTRRRDDREREQVGGDNRESAGLVRAGDESSEIADRAIGGRVLEERAEDRFLRAGFGRADENPDPERFRAGAEQGDRLGMTVVGDKKRVAALDVVAESHGLGRGGGLVEQGGIGNLHAREVADHRLKVEQRLQPALGDLRLIRRVSGIPARVFQNVPADDRGRVCPVIAGSDTGLRDHVAVHQSPEVGERLFLRARGGQRELAAEADVRGNGFLDEGIERSRSHNAEHGFPFRPGGPDMA